MTDQLDVKAIRNKVYGAKVLTGQGWRVFAECHSDLLRVCDRVESVEAENAQLCDEVDLVTKKSSFYEAAANNKTQENYRLGNELVKAEIENTRLRAELDAPKEKSERGYPLAHRVSLFAIPTSDPC